MRGVVSAGALGALLDLDVDAEMFDAAYGSSAGAMNLTYYLAKQSEGVRAYEEDLCDGKFLDMKRHVRRRMVAIKDAHVDLARRSVARATGRARDAERATMADVSALADGALDFMDDGVGNHTPAMNVHYLLEDVMGGRTGRPLNWRAVIDSATPLKIVATSLDNLSTVILEDFKDEADLKMCLLASARVPALAGVAPVFHRGHRLVDAAVLESVPVNAAARDGCTHMLVLLTSPLPSNEDDGGNVNVSHSMDDVSSHSSEDASSNKPASTALYRAIRNLLFAPAYMCDIWRYFDALEDTLARRFAWRTKDILSTKSRASAAFAPIKITLVAPSGPASRVMSSLSVDASVAAAARVEGADAVRRLFATREREPA